MNDKKTSLTPELRFPDFESEWEAVEFGRLIQESREVSTEEDEDILLSCSIDGMFLNSELFSHQRGYSNIGYRKVKKNMLVLSAQNLHLGNANVNNRFDHGLVSPAYKIYHILGCHPQFLGHWVKKDDTKNFFLAATTEGASGCRKNVVWDQLYQQKIAIPSLAEQKKIAAFLSSVDDVIAAESDRLTALKDHKKGLMQQLFPQKGQTQPAKRFPGFDGDWPWTNGNILFEAISNKNHNSDLPILALTQDLGAVPRDAINYTVQVSEKSIEGYKVVEVDDFIISLRSFEGGIEYSRYKGLCSPAYIVLRKRNKKLVSDFYRIYFKSYNFIQELNKNLEGIRDGKMVSYKQFSEISLPVPSIPEQQKIADCLTSLDDEIQAQQQKVDALKEHKCGLMQKLFPHID